MRAFALILGLLVAGCGAEIGDECSSNTECGAGRVCDFSSEGGYCTVAECEGSSCPANSVCVEFENETSYCMALCDTTGDCRDGYVCDDQSGPAPYCRERAE